MSQKNFFKQINQTKIKTYKHLANKNTSIKKIFQDNLVMTRLQDFFDIAWPINIDNFKKPSKIFLALVRASYVSKILLLITTFGLLVSVFFSFSNLYTLATVEVPTEGGSLIEAVIEDPLYRMALFNPVLETNSEAEEKINRLMYFPLYYIDYPDYLKDDSDPTIEKVLLEQDPSWLEELNGEKIQKYTVLNFKLRNNIFWHSGKPITTNDVEYTFNRLTEETGNRTFRDNLRKLEFKIISKTEFNLTSKFPDPDLIYKANFYPISKSYYKGANNQELFRSPKSRNPIETSGYFNLPIKARDPKNPKIELNNPVSRKTSENIDAIFEAVILERNPQINYKKTYLDQYIFKAYDTIKDQGHQLVSLEKDAKNQRVDLFTRFLSGNFDLTSKEIKNLTNFQQKVLPVNIYYTFFLNIQRGNYFINKNFRRYVVCRLMDFETNFERDFLEKIPKDKRILPLQFKQTATPDCKNPLDRLVESTEYSWIKEDDNNINRVKVFDKEITLTLIGSEELSDVMSKLQNYFIEMGIKTDSYTEPEEVAKKLESKEYDLAFLPRIYGSQDPYQIYGLEGMNLSNISQNSRLEIDFEKTIKKYSESDLKDEEAKNKLIEFFENEYISVNIYRSKQEINYSPKIGNFDIAKNIYTGLEDHFLNFDKWYLETRRKSRFGS